MKIFNTLTRQKEELKTITPGQVKIYACGPTVYNYIHIGNARPICVFDTLRRFLEYIGYQVTFVQNFTDIDDKIIRKANEEGSDFAQVSERFIAEYKVDAQGLGVREATYHPKATENIQNIIDLISSLMDKGFAYRAENGDVYFRAARFDEYGKLSHMPLEDLEAGARISVGEIKEDPVDFALWKAAKEGEPYWESPFGKGRPGWHIECSAMAKHYLGDTIDIHCGGQDLIFPHHENEIAQSECANGCAFAHYWMHNGYINIDNRKMSKSLGNFFTVREVAEQFGYEPIRFMMIAAHYRSPINYSVEVINQSISALERLYNCRDELDFALSQAGAEGSDALQKAADEAKEKFIAALSDDLNTADGIAALFDLCKEINLRLNGEEPQQKAALEHAAQIFDELAGVLGLLYNRKKNEVTPEIQELVDRRQAARKAKDFAEADALRDQLAAMGVTLKDTPEGVQIIIK
ncbi:MULTISPECIES: cysteine--tRNA ligase [Eubacteriales]|uniref:Cysteine--tRNA ligase n=1 Tax=Bittarella massiliensis (ex Durand et al. 2017) TaxID=1720313 RepID=A0AAQ1RWU8_9FIRM|nr:MULTISPECIES: cysteine--tRNA ligase [Eubacteriales]ERI97982.1 cysteine--tRNA ligase [Clostridium sp. ATCC 29733]MZL69831.1 cysteine--tRNA ligase [Bittarella massiliensis (ex Durand et al. 2017)]MZL81436.1 cysteine--tRNA ligase [Bittarella massiliensis (ex Durand et al. 2017)]SHG48352.1 cysteinyl-tRNA synthetase [Bittarella massiliensis (ex Durand et al. 2017)]